MAARLGDLAGEDLVGDQFLALDVVRQVILQAVGKLERGLGRNVSVPASSEGAHFQRISTPPNR